MKKPELASEIFKGSVKEILNCKNDNLEKNQITTGKLIREIGQGCFNCAPTNIWGKTNKFEEKMSLLEDEKIESSYGLLVLGYGDAENNGWYGAGPTRDMRRAYYTPMLLAINSETNLGKKTFFSNKVSDKENAGFEIFAANKKRQEKNYYCDLGVLLKFGNFSGHRFIPSEIRETSPINGPLSLAMNGKENLMQGPVKELYGFLYNCYHKFGAVVDKIHSPTQENIDVYPLVFVDNS